MTQPSETAAPRLIGHAIATGFGLTALVAGYESATHHMPGVMTGVLFALGVLLPSLAHFSWRGSRVAWAYVNALMFVFGIVTFFGAPKVRDVLGLKLAIAMVIPVLMFIGVGALSMCRSEYRAKT